MTVTSFGESLVLSSEDSADVVERINRYGFWQRMDGNYCDCAGDYGMTIGEVRVVGGHLHWDERGLTLNLNDEDTREINWIAERYLRGMRG